MLLTGTCRHCGSWSLSWWGCSDWTHHQTVTCPPSRLFNVSNVLFLSPTLLPLYEWRLNCFLRCTVWREVWREGRYVRASERRRTRATNSWVLSAVRGTDTQTHQRCFIHCVICHTAAPPATGSVLWVEATGAKQPHQNVLLYSYLFTTIGRMQYN